MTRSADEFAGSGAYVLNALDEAGRAEFETFLAHSEVLSTEVRELAETAALLGLSVEPVQPPSGLKSEILSRLATTPQLQADATGIPTPDSAATRAKVQARWFSRPVIAVTAAAAAIALIVGAGVAATALGDRGFELAQADQLAAINAADDLQQAAAPVATGGTATLVWSGELGLSALIIDGLEDIPDDRTYQLWYMDAEGTPTGAGLFDVDSERTWRVLDGHMSAGDTVGVTIEPRGGSTAPTTNPIIAIASA